MSCDEFGFSFKIPVRKIFEFKINLSTDWNENKYKLEKGTQKQISKSKVNERLVDESN